MEINFEHRKGRRGGKGDRDRRDPGASRPYRFAIFAEADGGYVLRSPDLPGRTATVSSLEEVGAAVQSAVDVRTAEIAAEDEQDEGLYSGKFVLRLPRTLHRQLAELAVEEGVSLNQLALTFIAEGMGRVDAAQDFGDKRRGPRRERPGGHGPRGRRGHREDQEGNRPGARGFGSGGHGPGGRGFGRESREDGNPEERFGTREHGFGRKGEGRGHRRPNFAGRFPGIDARPATPADPDRPRLV